MEFLRRFLTGRALVGGARWVSSALASATLACSAPVQSGAGHAESRGAAIEFSFVGAEGERVSSATTRGRATAIAFITTYDVPSQLQLRLLREAVLSTEPKANAVAVLLEPPKYAALISTYEESLELPFPMVMADHATLERRGPFGYIDRVPTTVVLDYRGREVWRYSGPSELAELVRALEVGARPREVERSRD